MEMKNNIVIGFLWAEQMCIWNEKILPDSTVKIKENLEFECVFNVMH